MMRTKIGYKLVRKMRDGYAPLFINKRQRMQPGVTYIAGDHPTKGFAHRPGWHICSSPWAPHLKDSKAERVWVKVAFIVDRTEERPEAQGGTWYLGRTMKIIEEVDPSAILAGATEEAA